MFQYTSLRTAGVALQKASEHIHVNFGRGAEYVKLAGDDLIEGHRMLDEQNSWEDCAFCLRDCAENLEKSSKALAELEGVNVDNILYVSKCLHSASQVSGCVNMACAAAPDIERAGDYLILVAPSFANAGHSLQQFAVALRGESKTGKLVHL
jgi:hypothetical protein